MSKLTRRSMLRQSSGLAGAALIPAADSPRPGTRPEPDRKLHVVGIGGHFDDPQAGCGGTLTLYADEGHDVVVLSLTGGPPPKPDANPEDRQVKNRLNAIKMAEVLKLRLECLNYGGSNSGQFSLPIIYGTGCEINGDRYKEFTEILLDHYRPDIVFTHWPIDFHIDHRAAGLLAYSAWLSSGKKFPLYYYESELGTQTQNFWPTHYVDITSVEERKHQAFMADTLWLANNALYFATQEFRGLEHGCKVAEAFNLHPQSPATPALP